MLLPDGPLRRVVKLVCSLVLILYVLEPFAGGLGSVGVDPKVLGSRLSKSNGLYVPALGSLQEDTQKYMEEGLAAQRRTQAAVLKGVMEDLMPVLRRRMADDSLLQGYAADVRISIEGGTPSVVVCLAVHASSTRSTMRRSSAQADSGPKADQTARRQAVAARMRSLIEQVAGIPAETVGVVFQ